MIDLNFGEDDMTNTIDNLIAVQARAQQQRADNVLDVAVFTIQAAVWLVSCALVIGIISNYLGV